MTPSFAIKLQVEELDDAMADILLVTELFHPAHGGTPVLFENIYERRFIGGVRVKF